MSVTRETRAPGRSIHIQWIGVLVFIVFSVVACIAGVAVAIAEDVPEWPIARSISRILPLAKPLIVYADAVANDPRRKRELPAAREAAERALDISPRRLGAWLAYVDVLVAGDKGRISEGALAALRRSYILSRYDYSYGVSRTAFAYNHWTELSPEVRAFAAGEAACIYPLWWKELDAAAGRIADQKGRFALMLTGRSAKRGKNPCALS